MSDQLKTRVTISTGRTFEVALLNRHQRIELLAENDFLGTPRTFHDQMEVLRVRLNTCLESIKSAGGSTTLEELEQLTVPEIRELFLAIVNATVQFGRLEMGRGPRFLM